MDTSTEIKLLKKQVKVLKSRHVGDANNIKNLMAKNDMIIKRMGRLERITLRLQGIDPDHGQYEVLK